MSGKAGRPAAQHLEAREPRPGRDELLGQQRLLDRPDAGRQPFHQRQVVAEAAQQRHRRMRVEVEQAGNDDVVGQVGHERCSVACPQFGSRSDGDDGTGIVDRDRVSFEDDAGRFDRHDPARHDQFSDGRMRSHRLEYSGFAAAPASVVADRPSGTAPAMARRPSARRGRMLKSPVAFLVRSSVVRHRKEPGTHPCRATAHRPDQGPHARCPIRTNPAIDLRS